jgi:NAD(P)-dependent dehydrogenase (short-subunit alcohol dehydrogenase family)
MAGETAHAVDPAATRAWPAGGTAVILGATGGLGSALVAALQDCREFHQVLGFSRRSEPALDLLDEASIEACAACAAAAGNVRLVVVATGFLHAADYRPERSWRELDAGHLQRAFALNAIGPALVMKHFLPLLPRQGSAVFAALSARVGSIGDNRLGGWHAYRASKAALNQLVRTASIELRRHNPAAVCLAIHPGTVATALSAPFATAGLEVQAPAEAAGKLVELLLDRTVGEPGTFVDNRGRPIPW